MPQPAHTFRQSLRSADIDNLIDLLQYESKRLAPPLVQPTQPENLKADGDQTGVVFRRLLRYLGPSMSIEQGQ